MLPPLPTAPAACSTAPEGPRHSLCGWDGEWGWAGAGLAFLLSHRLLLGPAAVGCLSSLTGSKGQVKINFLRFVEALWAG